MCRERAEDRHIAALREEQSYKHWKNGEKKRQVERLKLTREQEGRWARENATRTASQPPIIMVCLILCTCIHLHVHVHVYTHVHV